MSFISNFSYGKGQTNNVSYGSQSLSKTQSEYDMGYIAVKGDKEQQVRAQNLISELKTRLSIQEFNKNSAIYTNLATIFSKDKNATADDIINTYKMLQHPDDSTLLSPKGVLELLNDFIRKVGTNKTTAEDYIKSDVITVSLLQTMLKQVAKGENFIIPTGIVDSGSKKEEVSSESTLTRSDDVLKHLEDRYIKHFGENVTKGSNPSINSPNGMIIGKNGIIKHLK